MARIWRAVAIGAALAATGCSGLGGPAPTPSPKGELVLGLAPERSGAAQVAAAQQVAEQLATQLRLPVTVRPETTAAALDSDLAAGRVDLAWSDSLTYVALTRGHSYPPVLQAARCYPTYTPNPPPSNCHPQPGTPAIIICGAAAQVPELVDGGDWSVLSGKPVAFQDPASLPGYVWPRYFLRKNAINPDKDVLKGVPTPNDAAVALAVYNGLSYCGGMRGDGRLDAVQFAPDIFDRTKVVFVAPGNVPGDVVYLSGRLNADQTRKVRAALLKLGAAPGASAAIQQLTGGDTAMLRANDHDFDLLRSAVASENPKLVEQVLPTPSPTASVRRPASPKPTRR